MSRGPGSVRIAGGVHRGRRIAIPASGEVRPTSDKVRAAIFNILGHREWDGVGALPRGARVLDAFAGTGALGIEALSRGAAEVMFLERDPRVRRSLEKVIEELDEIQRAYVLPRDATRPGSRPGEQRFDLGFVGTIVDPIHARKAMFFEGFGGGDVGGYHEFFDQAMTCEALTPADALDLPVRAEYDLVLGEIQVEGAALGACRRQCVESRIERP